VPTGYYNTISETLYICTVIFPHITVIYKERASEMLHKVQYIKPEAAGALFFENNEVW